MSVQNGGRVDDLGPQTATVGDKAAVGGDQVSGPVGGQVGEHHGPDYLNAGIGQPAAARRKRIVPEADPPGHP